MRTNCANTFTASVAHSPYLEDFPPPQKDNRTLIMGIAVIACLLVGTGLIFGFLVVERRHASRRRGRRGRGEGRREAVLHHSRPLLGPMFTAKGEPIIVPDGH